MNTIRKGTHNQDEYIMDLSKLTNNQLYGLIQNAALDKDLRSLANIEFDRRKLSLDQMNEIMLRQDARFKDDKNAPLKIRYRFLLGFISFLHACSMDICIWIFGKWASSEMEKLLVLYWHRVSFLDYSIALV